MCRHQALHTCALHSHLSLFVPTSFSLAHTHIHIPTHSHLVHAPLCVTWLWGSHPPSNPHTCRAASSGISEHPSSLIHLSILMSCSSGRVCMLSTPLKVFLSYSCAPQPCKAGISPPSLCLHCPSPRDSVPPSSQHCGSLGGCPSAISTLWMGTHIFLLPQVHSLFYMVTIFFFFLPTLLAHCHPNTFIHSNSHCPPLLCVGVYICRKPGNPAIVEASTPSSVIPIPSLAWPQQLPQGLPGRGWG